MKRTDITQTKQEVEMVKLFVLEHGNGEFPANGFEIETSDEVNNEIMNAWDRKEKEDPVKTTVRDIVLSKIVQEFEKGVIPWRKTWKGTAPMNFVTKREYRGISRLLLFLSSYSSPYFLTFKQVQQLEGQVKKGEKSHLVVYCHRPDRKAEEGEEEQNSRYDFFLRYYNVFNIEQTTLQIPEDDEINGKIPEAEKVIETYDQMPPVEFGNPSYHVKQDVIRMPKISDFEDSEYYYKALFHEVSHSTGHKDKLDRDMNGNFGSVSYSVEELIAELTSAFLTSYCGMDFKVKDTASYLHGWSNFLKDNRTAIFQASANAERSMRYILEHSIKKEVENG